MTKTAKRTRVQHSGLAVIEWLAKKRYLLRSLLCFIFPTLRRKFTALLEARGAVLSPNSVI